MKIRRFDAVLFDLDGTLVDSLADLAASVNEVLGSRGWPQHDQAAYRRMVGGGIVNLMTQALPPAGRTEGEIAQAVEVLRDVYARRWNDTTRPYPGIPEMLGELQQASYALAVLSNKPHGPTLTVVEANFGRQVFSEVRGVGDGYPPKPDPTGALAVAKDLGLEPRRCVYVGDTGSDMITAVRSGMFAVGVAWGFREVEELRADGAQALLVAPSDLLALLQ